jgi:hypothetical protein
MWRSWFAVVVYLVIGLDLFLIALLANPDWLALVGGSLVGWLFGASFVLWLFILHRMGWLRPPWQRRSGD